MKTIIMTQKEFDELPTYSLSSPTAPPLGKKWKRQWRGSQWFLCEYVESNEPGYVCIDKSKIEILDALPAPVLDKRMMEITQEVDRLYHACTTSEGRINCITDYIERLLVKAESLPDGIQEALNSGDGTYRP